VSGKVGELITISGSGWAPGARFMVSGTGVSATGFADAAGDWTAQVSAPTTITGTGIKPVNLELTASEDGAPVASATVKVVNFLVRLDEPRGALTESTRWSFGGFLPGKAIFLHVKRGDRVYTTRAGRGDKPCGRTKKRLPRLPGVANIRAGTYKLFVDNRKRFKTGGRQWRGEIAVS